MSSGRCPGSGAGGPRLVGGSRLLLSVVPCGLLLVALLGQGPALNAGNGPLSGALQVHAAGMQDPSLAPTAVTASPGLPPPPPPVPPSPVPTSTPTERVGVRATATATAVSSPATPAPGSGAGSFLIRGVRVERPGATPDWNLSRTPLRRVTAGAGIQLSLYISFTSLPPGSRIGVVATVERNGRIVYRAGLREDRTGTGDLWIHWNFTPRKPGSYLITGRVKEHGRTRLVSTTFTAIALPISFSFDRLVTEDVSGRPAYRFAYQQRVLVVATITVQHAGGSVGAMVEQSLQYSSRHGWKALGRTVQNSFVTTNGRHVYMVSFYPQSPHSRLRMGLSVTIASRTEQRDVSFEVHR